MTAVSGFVERVSDEKAARTIPPETCPVINRCRDAVQSVMKSCQANSGRWRQGYQYETVEDFADAVEQDLYSVLGDLEEIRQHNASLRDLGIDWYEIAKAIAEQAEASK